MIWGQPTSRIDERDTTFARVARQPGTAAYAEYYGRRPERRTPDDRTRALPELLKPGGLHFDPVLCAEADAWFARIDSSTPEAERAAGLAARLRETATFTETLTVIAGELGALASGACPLDPAFVYTHKGRFDGDYGQPVTIDHVSAFLVLVEMDHDEMRHAPHAHAIRESARQYYRAAVIVRQLEAALRMAGYAAKAHFDAHYDVILPPLAVAAGLGELGRHNLLIADGVGTRVRIAAVTTNAPLSCGTPTSRGVRRFCEDCLKCADACPSGALSAGPRVGVNGILKWPTDSERCYRYWRAIGTDCGLCMAVCPFSHRNTWFHNVVRGLIRLAPWLAPALVLADDVVYGRRRRGGER